MSPDTASEVIKKPSVDTFSLPDPLNQISLGTWPQNLEGARLPRDGHHRPYQSFANSGLLARPSSQAVFISPMMLESGHTHVCVCCPRQNLTCLPLQNSVDTCLSGSCCSNTDSDSYVAEVLHPPICISVGVGGGGACAPSSY